MKYRIMDLQGWMVVSVSGGAGNNEPLRVKHLFKRWIPAGRLQVIVNLKGMEEIGVWEMGLLTSFKEEVDQRGGLLRVCGLDPGLRGHLQKGCFKKVFDCYPDLESALLALESTMKTSEVKEGL